MAMHEYCHQYYNQALLQQRAQSKGALEPAPDTYVGSVVKHFYTKREVRRDDASSCIGPVVLEHTPGKPLLCQSSSTSAGAILGGEKVGGQWEGKTGQGEVILGVAGLERGVKSGCGHQTPSKHLSPGCMPPKSKQPIGMAKATSIIWDSRKPVQNIIKSSLRTTLGWMQPADPF